MVKEILKYTAGVAVGVLGTIFGPKVFNRKKGGKKKAKSQED